MLGFLESIALKVVTPLLAIAGLALPFTDNSSLRLDVSHLQETVAEEQQINTDQTEVIGDVVKVLYQIAGGSSSLQDFQDNLSNLGATFDIPTPIALFETSLRTSISDSSTSFTLVSATDKDGNTLASSTYAFIIDEGSSNEEFVIADCTGTSCTNAIRGVSVLTGTSSVSSLQKDHRRGASVKITDGPILLILTRLANGVMDFPNTLRYKSNVSTTTIAANDQNLVNVELLNYTAFNGAGVISATESAQGVLEIATQLEMASTTATGSSGPLAITSAYSTSTSPASGHYAVITESDGNIDEDFLPSTLANNYTLSGSNTVSGATTTFSGSSVNFSAVSDVVGVASSSIHMYTATSTWTKPAGVEYVKVEVIGAGGSGASASSDPAGGAGGAYCLGYINVTGVSSVSIGVGTGGTASSNANGKVGGISSFGTYVVAAGGPGGTTSGASLGGDCSGTVPMVEIENFDGSKGNEGNSTNQDIGGFGGGNVYGRGGMGGWQADSSDGAEAGQAGTGYGAGGGGATNSVASGAGANGLVIVHEIY